MTMREALDAAMHRPGADDAMSALHERGVAVADLDTMTQAVHDVYCGILADHQHPNEKDRQQAQQLLDALSRQSGI
jgi:thiamine pyrophosphokinase